MLAAQGWRQRHEARGRRPREGGAAGGPAARAAATRRARRALLSGPRPLSSRPLPGPLLVTTRRAPEGSPAPSLRTRPRSSGPRPLAEPPVRRRRGRKMAWVLKMDEVIESGLVHDFDASLSGIGQELGAGAYSMRYLAPRPGGRALLSAGRACTTLGLCQARRRPACPVSPVAGPGLPRGHRARKPPRPRPPGGGCGSRSRGLHFCCKTRPAVSRAWAGGGRGFLSWQVIYKPLRAGNTL